MKPSISLLLLCVATTACVGADEHSDDVGVQSAAIVGGTMVPEGAAPPYMARFSDGSSPHYCGGTLISDEWVLTAGHCIGTDSMFGAVITLGDWDRTETSGHEQERAVRQIIRHPNFGGVGVNDLALVRLSSPVAITTWVAPIDELGTTAVGVGSTGVVYGWGLDNDSQSGTPPDELRTATIPRIPQADCTTQWSVSPSFAITSKHFCAMTASPYTTINRFDSGGPFVTVAGGITTLRGVTSLAYAPDHRAGVFVDVRQYKAWIDDVVFDSIWLDPTADSSVFGGYPNDNFGTSSLGEIRYLNTTTYNAELYSRFDLSSVTEPVLGATLWQLCYTLSAGGSDPVVRLHEVTGAGAGSWLESAITWNNRPTTSTNLISKTITNPALALYEWKGTALTNAVDANKGGTISFRQLITTSTTRFVRCGMREGAWTALQVRTN